LPISTAGSTDGRPPDAQAHVVPSDRVSVVRTLAEAGCVAPVREAEELIRAAAGDPVALNDLVERRTAGEPIAWLIGSVTFCGIDLSVAPGVYVPRPQSEPLARRAASLLPPGGVAVDLCTGTGAIAAVMATAVPTARVFATDLDEGAVRCALRNGVDALLGSLDGPLPRELEHHVDVLTAVVPYVPTDAIRLLPRDVRSFEPWFALDGGVDGTDLLTDVVRSSPRWMRSGGWVLLELGGDQAEPIGRSLRGSGFEDVETMTDEDGDPRAVCARFGRPT
jgi:release factor glutamine methyltransferase